MAKPEICSTSFASRQSKTQKDNVRDFYIFIKVLYQQNCDIINDIIDYLLCSVLSNELFIKVISLLLLWVIHMKTKCPFQRYVKWALDTKLFDAKFSTKNVSGLNNLKLMS